MKKLIFGFVALGTIGMLSLPASADQVSIQDSTQVTTQQGNGNFSYQHGSQTSTNIKTDNRNSQRPAQGSAQRNYQDTFQQGDRNVSISTTEQEVRQESSRNR